MKKSNSISPFRLPSLFFFKREKSFLGKQQLYVLTCCLVTIVLGILTNLAGISGPQQSFNLWLNVGYILGVTSLFVAYLYHKLALPHTLFCLILLTQIVTCVEMLYCALTPTSYHLMLIVGNTVLLAINILFSLIAYLKYAPYILCTMGMGSYIACVCLTNNTILVNFLGVFLIIFIIVCVLGSSLIQNMHLLHQENSSLKKDEEVFFRRLGLRKEQVTAYIELAQKRRGLNHTENLFRILGEDLQRNIIANIREYIAAEESRMLEMERIFPELSVSEREVCRLILQGKKLGEICSILDKKESNINSTRVHIRRKLNMNPSDNLRDVLRGRIGSCSQADDL